MHSVVFYVVTVWISLLFILTAIRMIKAKSIATRILAFDTLTLLFVFLLALIALMQDSAYYLDAALVVAMFSFLGTLAAARYYERGRLLE